MASTPGNTPQKKGEDGEPKTKKAKVELTDPRTRPQPVGSGDVSEDLICLLCKEVYKDPIIIMCGHNFCRGCMDKAWKGDTFTCPDCKKVINNKMFITNQALANLVRKTAGAGPALFLKKAHVLTRCAEHDEILKLFCKDDGALICMICRDALKHTGHSFLPFPDAYEMYRKRLSAIVTPMEEAMKETEQLVDKQYEKIEQNDTNLEECEQHIVSEFEKLRDFLQDQQETLLGKLREQSNDLRTEMQSAVTKMQKNKVNLRQAITVAKEKMKDTESTSFLNNIKSFVEQCEEQQKEALSFRNALVDKQINLRTFKGPIQLSVWQEMKSLFASDVPNAKVQKAPKKYPDVPKAEVQKEEPPKSYPDIQPVVYKHDEIFAEDIDPYFEDEVIPSKAADKTADARVDEPQEEEPSTGSTSASMAVSKAVPASAPAEGGKQIWIIGNYIVKMAKEQAMVAYYQHDLGFGSQGHTVHWMPYDGMRWEELLPSLKKKVVTMGTPDVLVIHLGGNDLGIINRQVLIEIIKKDLATMLSLYKDTAIVWSCVLPRTYWVRVPLERCRKNLNRNICRHGTKIGFRTIYHYKIEILFKEVRTPIKRKQYTGPPAMWLDIFNLNVQEAITLALSGASGAQEAFEDSS